ncbi:MAG: hypothetical protein IAE79_26625 [Anaerolinea sp.]|nr:hypothetical protein [Anaerolinea sp.]
MNKLQAFFVKMMPAAWAREMEAESRQWMVRCTCGFERSVWDSGGMRWKAHAARRQYRLCPQCGEKTWHAVYLKREA